MILQVETNNIDFKIGEYVAFITGAKSVNTTPKYLRIGIVRKVTKELKTVDEVEEVSTGKIWKPYNGDVVKVGEGIAIKGVKAKIELVENLL